MAFTGAAVVPEAFRCGIPVSVSIPFGDLALPRGYSLKLLWDTLTDGIPCRFMTKSNALWLMTTLLPLSQHKESTNVPVPRSRLSRFYLTQAKLRRGRS